jgi:phage terminase large subunit-like protein
MPRNKHVDEYIELYRSGKIKLNEERIMLIEYLERDVFTRDDIFFDDEMIDNCIKFGEKWYFPLQPFQKFLIAFVFLYYKGKKATFYRKFLWTLGRGGGKNGLMSVIMHFLVSPFHDVLDYHISVVANSEEQAKTSPDEIHKTIKRNPPLQNHFKTTLTQTMGKATGSIIKFRTSNGDTKDGLRDGAVLFDEVHQYESNKDVRVHISGLGKKLPPREFYIGTDGYVREGFLDSLKAKALKVLRGESRVNALFPFICKLDNEDQVNDPANFELANPMLSEPRGDYAEGLYSTILDEYEDLEDDPSNREEFMTKRMNLPFISLEKSVAKEEKIMSTARPIDVPLGQPAIASLDFASINDFAAVGLLFRDPEDNYIFMSHSFARKEFVDIHYGYSRKRNDEHKKKKFAPIKEWEEKGLLTIVDEPSISPQHIVDWLVQKREQYDITKIVVDNFKLETTRKFLEDAGFEVEHIRNPRAIHGLLAPRIDAAFAGEKIIFGDNPLMRWYTRNVLVVTKKTGLKEYDKKEPIKRKTDGFHAFVHAMYRADEITVSGEGLFYDLDF